MVKIIKCYCQNEFQDKKYGKNKRVANSTMKDGQHRYTVCGKTN